MNIAADSREDYMSRAGEREPELRKLDAFIRSHAPHLVPVLAAGMTGKMLGYGMQPYQTKSMKQSGEWPVVMLAAQKNYLSLYVCVVENGQYLAEKYADRLGMVNCGKSCIRFKRLQDVDARILQEMLEHIDTRFAAGVQLYGL